MTNKKGRTERSDLKQNDHRNSTDPVLGWHGLAKPARLNRQQKRGWRRKNRGDAAVDLLVVLIIAVVAVLAGVLA